MICKLVSSHGLSRRGRQGFRVGITSSASTSTFSLASSPASSWFLMWGTIVKGGDVDPSSVPPCILGQTIGMGFQLMRLQIHLRLEDDELLLQAFLISAHEMVTPKVLLQRIVVDVILLLAAPIPAIANMASFMFVPTMDVQFIVSIESLTTETAFRMPFETALVDSARVIISKLLMLAQLLWGKELMLMCEDLLISCTQIAQDLVVY